MLTEGINSTVTLPMPSPKMEIADRALAERARRELARRRFKPFCHYIDDKYEDALHQELLGFYLEQVELYIETKGERGISRLIVEEPPRYGKTDQSAKKFPAWVLGRLPDTKIIIGSYASDLAEESSEAVRNIVKGNEYQNVFGKDSNLEKPVILSDESQAKDRWHLAEPHRGGVNAAGIGGGLTGKGAHLFIIDDPYKTRDDAESEAYRKRVINWYQSVVYQRLEKGAAIIIIHTRWHPDDLIGILLKRMAGDDPLVDQWTVVHLPALALDESEYPKSEEEFKENLLRGLYIPYKDMLDRKPGEALWPEMFPVDYLARKKANAEEFEFASLDQQMPRPQSGGFFDEENIKIIDRAPEGLLWFGYVDLALGESKQSDWNAVMPMALDGDGNLYGRDLLHVHDLDQFLLDLESFCLDPRNTGMLLGTGTVIWGIEDVAFQSRVFKELIKKPKLANLPFMRVKPDGDKVVRARPVRTKALSGNFYLVRGGWNITAIRQLISFPTGKHDDIVDTISGGLQMIAEHARYGDRKAAQHEG